MDVHSGETGTRIFMPLKSSTVLIGLVEVVVWRKPLSQIFSMATRLAFAIWPRTNAPRSPSMAFQTVS